MNIRPPGGYRFQERDGTKLHASSFKALSRAVAIYRANAQLPPGSPEEEVLEQACRDNASLCLPGEFIPSAPPAQRAGLRRVQWLIAWGKQAKATDGIVFVSAEQARQRADVCAACPANVKVPEDCSSCRKAVTTLQSNVIGTSRAVDPRIGVCNVIGCDLAAAVHLDEIRVNEASLPAGCWRKIEIP